MTDLPVSYDALRQVYKGLASDNEALRAQLADAKEVLREVDRERSANGFKCQFCQCLGDGDNHDRCKLAKVLGEWWRA